MASTQASVAPRQVRARDKNSAVYLETGHWAVALVSSDRIAMCSDKRYHIQQNRVSEISLSSRHFHGTFRINEMDQGRFASASVDPPNDSDSFGGFRDPARRSCLENTGSSIVG
jgi:hypothetical protein